MKTSEDISKFKGEQTGSLLRQLTDHLGSALWLRTPDYSRFLFISPAWESIFAVPIERVLKEPLSFVEAIHPEDRPSVEEAMEREKADPGTFNMRFRVVHADGAVRHVWTRTFPVHDDNGELYRVCGVAQDVTVQVEAEEERIQNEVRLELQSAVTALMAQAGSLADTMPQILKHISEAMRWDWAAIWEIVPDSNLLRCVFWYFAKPELTPFREASRSLTLSKGQDLPGKVWKTGEATWIRSLGPTDLSRKEAAAQCGLINCLGIPLKAGGRSTAFMEFFGNKADEPHPKCVNVLSSLGSNIGQFIERKRAEELAAERGSDVQKFVAMLTHDLKTPLIAAGRVLKAVIQGKSGLLSPEQTDVLSMVQKNNEELLDMIQKALELYRNCGSLNREKIDVALTVRECIDQMSRAAEAASLILRNDLPKNLPEIKGDKDALKHLLINLLSNAIKFTPAGGSIVLNARVENHNVLLSVKDSGVGLSAAEQKNLFQPFWQGEAGRAKEGGSGLGLYLCRQIADSHGGKITCESEAGKGSTFTVSLPVQS